MKRAWQVMGGQGTTFIPWWHMDFKTQLAIAEVIVVWQQSSQNILDKQPHDIPNYPGNTKKAST